MIYISEYKPPHKLTTPHLRLGLRPMNIYKEVVKRKTIPTSVDPDARFQYFAERLTASTLTQTYHYMIEGGLEYILLTTGETIVFLVDSWLISLRRSPAETMSPNASTTFGSFAFSSS